MYIPFPGLTFQSRFVYLRWNLSLKVLRCHYENSSNIVVIYLLFYSCLSLFLTCRTWGRHEYSTELHSL